MLPIVTAILPNYNHASFLEKRINSILHQTYKSFELIILDDCSKDNSREIIEQYRQYPQVANIIYNSVNGGSTFKQWKKGIELAKGEYIWFAESDDYADDTFLEKLVPLFESNENVGLVFCNSRVVNGDNIAIGTTNNWGENYQGTDHDKRIIFFKGSQFCKDHLFLLNRIPNASAVLFKREPVISHLEWIDTYLKNSGDWKLWIKIALTSNVVWLNEELNYFRKHKNNVTNSLPLLKKEALYILKELIYTKSVAYNYKIYESLILWSFNSAAWTQDSTYSLRNLKLYLKDNFTFSGIFYLAWFFMKRLIISLISYFRLKTLKSNQN